MERIKNCLQEEEKKKRLAKKLKIEQEWLKKRKLQNPQSAAIDMEWEEVSLESCMTMLGLEGWDMTEQMEVDNMAEVEDWLDAWIRLLEEDDNDKEMVMEDTKELIEDMAMEQGLDESKDYMSWLMEELSELRIDGEVVQALKEMTL